MAKADEPKFRKVSVSDMNPAAYNPRRISAGALHGLEKSLDRFGLVEPIVWNKRTKNIVGGHQRFKVLQRKGVKTCMVVEVDLSLEDEKALNLTLNNTEIQGEWTSTVLDLIRDLEAETPDIADDLQLNELRRSLANEDLTLEGDEDSEEAEPNPEDKMLPEMEILPFEHYDYLLIVSDNVHDWNYLCERLGVRKVDTSTPGITGSNKRIGLGRAIKARKLVEMLQGKEPGK